MIEQAVVLHGLMLQQLCCQTQSKDTQQYWCITVWYSHGRVMMHCKLADQGRGCVTCTLVGQAPKGVLVLSHAHFFTRGGTSWYELNLCQIKNNLLAAHDYCSCLQLALNYTPVAVTTSTTTAVSTANVTNSTTAVYANQSLARYIGEFFHIH